MPLAKATGAENERRDRLAKRQLYGKYGVKEYWIVDFEKGMIEVHLLRGQTLELAVTPNRARRDNKFGSARIPLQGWHDLSI